jgi:hypothetical protein
MGSFDLIVLYIFFLFNMLERRTRIKQKIYHRDLISMKIILSTTLFLFLLFLREKTRLFFDGLIIRII